MAEFRLTEAQGRAVEHRGGALLISAGAGSGKTRVLVERLLARITQGGDMDRFLVITYTRAAAAELRGRILAALREKLRTAPTAHLRRQLLLLPQAKIGTIHSFCSALLRENAQLLDVRPDFRLLEGAEERLLRTETLQETLAGRYEDMTPGFQALVDALSSGESDRALGEVVLDAYDAVQSHPDPAAWLEKQMGATVSFADAGETIWGRSLLDRARRLVAFWRGQLEETLAGLGTSPRAEAGYGPSLRTTLEDLGELALALEQGWDAAAACESVRFPVLRGYKGIGDDPAAARAKARRDACKKTVEKVQALFAEDSAAHAEDMAAVSPVTGELLALVRDFSQAFTREKRRRGALDFSDLEHLALRLLTEEDRRTPSPLGRELSRRFDEILVDEYQDCNRVQDRIFFAVSDGGRNVTMVGDVKQSIYRFRLADPGLFLQKYDSYHDDPAPGQGKRILLPENFRSDAGILGPVNGFFSAVMSQALGELDYGADEALKPGPEAGCSEEAFRLFVTDGAGGGEEEDVAGYVAWLLRSGMTVPGPEGRRPLQPGDIAILLRSAKGRDGAYAEALKRRGIAANCLKSADDLEARPEVGWALSLLQIIDNPRQDIPLLTALRSPVFRFDEDRLARIRCFRRKGPYYDALKAAAETEEDCRAMLETLGRWRARSALVPAEELVSEVCAETGLRALAEAREPGSAANLDSLIAAAHDFAQSGREDLYSFISCLREARDPGKASVTARPGGGEGVAVTTVHGAKGLEYPVVILADLMRRFNLRDITKPLLIHPDLGVGVRRTDRARGIVYTTLPRMAIAEQIRAESLSEELRILYVAMTRARQHLALFCRVRDLGKARDSYGAGTGLPLPPEELEKASSPGAWVLAASLALGAQGPWAWRSPPSAEGAAPAQAAEEERPAASGEAAQLRANLTWRYPRSADTRLPSKLTATSLRSSFAAAEAAEGAGELRRRRYGPEDFPPPRLRGERELSPAEKGSAMHLALQYADLERCVTPEGAAEALAELEERRLLTKEQRAAVDAGKLHAFCVSEAMEALRKGRLHREFKFSLLAPVREFLGEGEGETLLQGVVDLWSELPEGILLLDYKTDRVTPENQAARAAEYEPQLRAYAWALERVTGKRVLRRMLWFFATGEAVDLGPL